MRGIWLLLLLSLAGNAWAMDLPEADSEAARLFAARCSACHALPHPKRLDWPHWRHMLRVMKRRIEERGVDMEGAEWRQIAAYLRRHAR
ncbi:MAG: hypothetical protein D6678_01380 [Zetaproteobacteria bacterium]|nr:MAG: hypothetical protein D6678_01380 [Zetaproteobacteria bacterium]